MGESLCSIKGCGGRREKRGWCATHYSRWRIHGDPNYLHPRLSTEERFWSKVDKTETCWLWTGPLFKGYGRFALDGKSLQPHRLSDEWLVGPIPEGLSIDHLCRVRKCVNPFHMEPVMLGENVLRGVSPSAMNVTKTYCVRGHPLSGENVQIWRKKRLCRECRRTAYFRQKNPLKP